MKPFYESTTAQFGIMVLSVAALAAGFTDGLSWKDWLEAAKWILGIYASKEGVRYGATDYENRS